MCCDIGSKETKVETASNSTLEHEEGLNSLMDNEMTVRLYRHLQEHRPVTVSAKAPTLDEVRVVIATDFIPDISDMFYY